MSSAFRPSWSVVHQSPLSMGFSRQEYLSGLPFPLPWDLPHPEMELKAPELAGEFFTTEPPGKPFHYVQKENLCNESKHDSQGSSQILEKTHEQLLQYNPVAIYAKIYPAAAAKLLQSCPTLCDPKDSRPPGSPVPGILQARTLEWIAISFSNAWKWKVKVKSLSHVQLLATPWTTAYQAPPPMGFSRQEYWSGVPLPSPKFYPTWC